MKARVKATGKIVDVVGEGVQNLNMVMTAHGEWFTKDELDIVPLSWKPFEPTYWQKLEHTYAGMAMQGMIRTIGHDRMYPPEKIAIYADACAHALIEKLKEKEERK